MSPSKPTRAPKAKKPAAKAKSVERAPSVASAEAVETLRIIPAATDAETPALELSEADKARSEAAVKLAADIERALATDGGVALDPKAVQLLLAALAKTYSAHIDCGATYSVFSNSRPVTATDVMVTASGMLKAANVAVFELGMWQSWTGR